MNFTTTKTDKGNFVTNEVKKPAPVSESELKTRISKVKNSLTSSMFDPHALKQGYDSVTEGRGYSAFSKEAMDEWHDLNGHMGPVEIKNLVDQKTDAFLKSVNDPSASNHAKNRESFKNEFEGSEQAVRDHFQNETNSQYGRTFRNGAPHFKDYSYENRMLATAPVSTQTGLAEKELFNSLMNSRWDCCGYADDDQQFIDKFYNYCIALKPANKG